MAWFCCLQRQRSPAGQRIDVPGYHVDYVAPQTASTSKSQEHQCIMGQFGSKKSDPLPTQSLPREPVSITNNTDFFMRKYGNLLREKGFVPDFLLVRESPSSQYVDEDGDVAHEFYAEKVDGNLRKLTRVVSNLRPQGKERHDIPRLSPDLPVVMLELPRTS